MKSNMKKFLALFLSLSLVLAAFGDFAQVKAADSYIDVMLTETSGWDTRVDGDHWVLYLKTDVNLRDDWAYKYKNFNIECNGVTGTSSQVSTGGTNLLHCTIPTSLVPTTDGTVFTIKGGLYEPDLDGQTEGINILNDLQIVVSEGRLVHAKVYEVGSATTFITSDMIASEAFYFDLKDKNGNEVLTGYESWGNWLSPAWCDGTRITQDTVPDQWSTVYSGVFIDGQPMDYWGAHFRNTDACGRFYINGLSAVVGTKITIRGMFASSTNSWTLNGSYFLEEFSFTFDGTNWNFSSPTEYTGITLQDNTDFEWGTYVDGTDWLLDVPATNYTSSDESYEYTNVKIECNGVEGTATKVTSLADNKLRFRIPTSLVPDKSGTTFTIKSGQCEPGNAATIDGLNILQDYDVVVVEGHLTHTQVVEAVNKNAFNNDGVDPKTGFFVVLQDENWNGVSTGTESGTWNTYFLNPAYCDGTRIENGDSGQWTSIYSGVFVDTGDGNKPLNYEAAFLQNVDPGYFHINLADFQIVNGTVVTVRGFFTSAATTAWNSFNGNFYLPEMKFLYEDADETDDVYGSWRYVEGPIYKQYEGTPVYESSEDAGFYFTAGETEFPYDADKWSVYAAGEDENSGIFLSQDGGVSYKKLSVNLQKVGEDRWYAWMAGDTSVTLGRNDIILLKGSFIYNDEHRITFAETKFMYNGSGYGPYVEVVDHGTIIPQFESSEKGGFYFTAEESATPVFPYDGASWNVRANGVDDESGVFLSKDGGDTYEKMDVSLQKIGENRWYVWIAGDTTNVPEKDDMIFITGTFAYENHQIEFFEELPVFYTGQYYTTQDPADAPDIESTTKVTINSIDYRNDYTKYNEAEGCWEITFKTENTELPSHYWNITYTVGDETYTGDLINQGKTYGNNVDLLLKIPNTVLPQNLKDLEEQYVITLKTGTAQGRDNTTHALQNSAINLNTDYQFVVGDSYDAVAPVVYYDANAGGGNGGDTTSIWLSSNDDFPYISTDWKFLIQEADEESGVFVYDESTKTYNRKDVCVIQHQDGGYYIKDFGPVEDGTTIMLKGTFTQSGLHFITFKTAKYTFKDGKWVVATAIKEVTGTEIDGDAIGDSNLNSADLVRMLKVFGELTNEINLTDADLNNTGDIDTYDIQLERKLLLGLKFYKGAPVYADDAEMRLAAYQAPTTEAGYATYAKAGFNTVIGDNVIMIDGEGEANFNQYMQWAKDNELKVLVGSASMWNMAQGTIEYNEAIIKEQYDKASAYGEYFLGFTMQDEVRYAWKDNEQKVADHLKYLDPSMTLFTSCHPLYADNEDYIWIDDELDSNQRYEQYAKTMGNMHGELTVDFYPFRHEDSGMLWWAVDEDYMRPQWFTNLDIAATVSKNSQGAFDTGYTVQSYAEKANSADYYRDLTQEDISFQVYSALAYGMKSINYFTYEPHPAISNVTNSMVDANGNTTTIYDAVKNVNNEIKAIDQILLKYNWLGTVGVAGDDYDRIIEYMNPYGVYTSERIVAKSFTSKNSKDTSKNADAIIGCLKDLNGYDGFMVVNATDPSDGISDVVSVSFNDADAAKVYVAGKEVDSSAYITANTDGTITFNATLNPGQGIFVIPYIQ